LSHKCRAGQALRKLLQACITFEPIRVAPNALMAENSNRPVIRGSPRPRVWSSRREPVECSVIAAPCELGPNASIIIWSWSSFCKGRSAQSPKGKFQSDLVWAFVSVALYLTFAGSDRSAILTGGRTVDSVVLVLAHRWPRHVNFPRLNHLSMSMPEVQLPHYSSSVL